MKDVRKTYYFLMIFLLFWFVVPTKQLYAQQENSKKQQSQEVIEQQILNHLRAGNAYGQNGNTIELPGFFDETSEYRRKELLDGKKGNYVSLAMDGEGNNVTAEQKGTGNAMEVLIDGNDNSLNYLQQGHNLYLKDEVLGNNYDYSIKQTGSELGLYLKGQQTIPNMIINQRGHGMKLRITGIPLK